MHEIGLMQQALDLALAHAAGQGARHIHRVTFRIGDEAGVMPDVIAMAFDVATRGTLAEGAELAIEHVPVMCCCPVCQQEFLPAEGDLLHTCLHCGRVGATVRCGREFELASLEVS